MKCLIKDKLVDRMSECEKFELRGDKPYSRIKPEEEKM